MRDSVSTGGGFVYRLGADMAGLTEKSSCHIGVKPA
jgi:hypothetical protein